MTDPSIIRQQQRERRERLERQRIEQERIDSIEASARADRQRTQDMLMALQEWNRPANLQKLFALDQLINGDRSEMKRSVLRGQK
jgi:hypothetical protein